MKKCRFVLFMNVYPGHHEPILIRYDPFEMFEDVIVCISAPLVLAYLADCLLVTSKQAVELPAFPRFLSRNS